MVIDCQVSLRENPNNGTFLRMGINLFPNMVLTNNINGISKNFPVFIYLPLPLEELDAAEGSAIVELETRELTAVLHVLVVGPSIDVKDGDFHKQVNMTTNERGDTLWDFSCLPRVIVQEFFGAHGNMSFNCFKWTKPFSEKVSGIPQTA